MKGNLYLIPNLLGGDNTDIVSKEVLESIKKIKHYIVENERDARRYLIKLGIKEANVAIDDLTFFVLDKRERSKGISEFVGCILKGNDVGLISDAGCPAVADPGALVVAEAHRKGIHILPLVGPSSILLSLMASGLNGQHFSFLGYLPIKNPDRINKLKQLDKIVGKEGTTQIFIETPYRNGHMFDDILKACSNQLKLCVSCDVTLQTQFIKTKSIDAWKKSKPNLHKRPTVFLLGR